MSALVQTRQTGMKFAEMLDAARPRLAMVIPRDMSVDRVIGVILNEVGRNPKLKECDPGSVIRAVIQATELGLDLSPKLGQAFLIPRKKKCELQLGYKGVLKKAYECDRILSVSAVLVHQADKFSIQKGTDPKIVHVEAPGDRGPVVSAYFAARLAPADANVWIVDDMSIGELLKIRDRSDGYKASVSYGFSSPWKTDEGEMCRKTMLVRGLKQAPISDSFRAALEADADDFKASRAAQQDAPAQGNRTSDLKSKLGVPEAADAEFEEEGEPEP